MAVQEDAELSDLVAQTLENSGVLSKIRAELRASVFLVLEEHEAFKGKNSAVTNKPLKEFIATLEGKIIISLIQEFLEYFGLEFTASVFEPEVDANNGCAYSGREKLASDLKLNSGKNVPLIAQILQESNISFSSASSPKESVLVEKDDKRRDEHKVEENTHHTKPIESFNSPVKLCGSSPQSTEGKLAPASNTPPLTLNQIKKPDRLDLNQTNSKPAGSLLASLGCLPPLGLSQNNKLSSNKNVKPIAHDLKAILDLGSDFSENNYEEDFFPSGSEKASKDTNISCSGSGSEIEEEMSVGLEDHTAEISSGKSSEDLR